MKKLSRFVYVLLGFSLYFCFLPLIADIIGMSNPDRYNNVPFIGAALLLVASGFGIIDSNQRKLTKEIEELKKENNLNEVAPLDQNSAPRKSGK